MRPVIAGSIYSAHRQGNCINIILKPLTQYVPSFFKDDYNFLNHLPNKIILPK